ncbi:MAG TPA: hypothetical protein VKM55_05235 [Candidatus Lokiarchaeia archaeon]|nr:hypothetical protein [Candidatus Lokiarchaeia archaeon]
MNGKKKTVMYYECSMCHSKKQPKKSSVIKDLEFMFQCPDCKHLGPFEEFLPSDTMRYLFC